MDSCFQSLLWAGMHRQIKANGNLLPDAPAGQAADSDPALQKLALFQKGMHRQPGAETGAQVHRGRASHTGLQANRHRRPFRT